MRLDTRSEDEEVSLHTRWLSAKGGGPRLQSVRRVCCFLWSVHREQMGSKGTFYGCDFSILKQIARFVEEDVSMDVFLLFGMREVAK